MKKIIATIIASTLLISSSAAAEDWTLLGTIHPNESINRAISLPPGKLILEVLPTKSNSRMTCQFIHNSQIIVEQKDVNSCKITPLLLDMTSINIKIFNLDKADLDYKLWIHGE